MEKNDQHNIYIFSPFVFLKWKKVIQFGPTWVWVNDLNYWVNYLFKHFMPWTEKTQKMQLKAESYWIQQNNSSQVLQCIYKYFKTVTFCGLSSKPYLLPQENIKICLGKSRCLTFIVPSAVHTILPKRLPFIIFFSFSEKKTKQKKHLRSPSGTNHTYCLCLSSPQGYSKCNYSLKKFQQQRSTNLHGLSGDPGVLK